MNHVSLSLIQDFEADFATITKGLAVDYSGPPYAFVRFADGEAAILRDSPHVAKSDGWKITRPMPTLREGLELALACELPGWCVGITAESHHEDDHAFLLEMAAVSSHRITMAELFIFANWDAFRRINTEHCRIVGAGADIVGSRGFHLPPDAVEDDKFDLEPAIEWMIDGQGPILLAAGPLAKVLAYEYWWTTTHLGIRREVCLDVGSAISPQLRGKKTRQYHSSSHATRRTVPQWKVGAS